jgi:branched-subunit amino acid aminotransferase/4-amino-4-deoxychorismate lyase
VEPTIAYLNGHFVPEEQAKLSLHDAGFTWGATVVDRARTYNRKWFRLPDHITRFRRSCELCRVPQSVPDSELTRFAEHLLEQNGPLTHPDDELSLVMFATPGAGYANLGMHTAPVDGLRHRSLLKRGARLVTPEVRHVPLECIPPQAKMRSRMFWWIAEQQAHDIDAEASALLLDLSGHITETAIANFVIVRGGVVISPPRESILDGVSLCFVEELCGRLEIGFDEKRLRLEDCYSADEALLTSTPFGVAGVSALNGRPIPWPGRLLQRLHDSWSAEVGMDIWRGIRA